MDLVVESPSLTTPTRGIPRSLTMHQLDRLVRAFGNAEGRWAPLVRFGTDDSRWWTRLHADSSVDVWLLTWLPGQLTDLHDHGSSAAAFVVARGRLQEVRANLAGTQHSTVHAAGQTSWIPTGAVHDVRAVDEPAVSIHAYSPPLQRMTYYDADAAFGLVPSRTVVSEEPEQGGAR
jgi:quercetin dioxygenase-like cupin family protein